MKNERILFMGGKYVGYECLRYLIDNSYLVIGCYVNKEDDSESRWYESLKELSLKHKIPTFYYEDVNSKDSEVNIRKLSPDIIVVVYYDQILKKNIIVIPPKGCINLHLALSQIHRGCYPTTWSLIRGDEYTGATLHFITEKIDGGPVIGQKKLKIKEDWTGKDLYYQVSDTGIALFKKCFPKLDEIKPYLIDVSKAPYYKKVFPSLEIKLDKKTINIIRALIFDPFPAPYIKIGRRIFTIIEYREPRTK